MAYLNGFLSTRACSLLGERITHLAALVAVSVVADVLRCRQTHYGDRGIMWGNSMQRLRAVRKPRVEMREYLFERKCVSMNRPEMGMSSFQLSLNSGGVG
jgi:hypothetical protein